MMRRQLVTAACALALLASASCTYRSEREELLPWLLRRSIYTEFGSFGGSTHTTFYAKYWGFWRSLEGWSVSIVDAEHILIESEAGYGLLARGSLRTNAVCTRGMATSVSLPPRPAAVDCVEAVAWDGGIAALRWRRFDPGGRLLDERTAQVIGPNRIFAPSPGVFAYDDEGRPYFLILDREAQADYRVRLRRCALVSVGGVPPIEGREDMDADDCRRTSWWSDLAGRALVNAGRERNGSAASTPVH
jgi:hypothetical protein